MTAVAERHEALVAEFEAFRKDPAFGSAALRASRERAFQKFLAGGFPSTRDEEWKFTNVSPIAATSFKRAAVASPERAAIEPFLFAGAGAEIVVVNGRFSKTLSSLEGLPPGVTVQASAFGSPGPEKRLAPAELAERGTGPKPPAGPFVELNNAFFEDVVHVDVAAKTIVELPLHVVMITAGDASPALVAPRIAVHVGEGAQVSIVESYAGIGQAATLTSVVTEVHLEPNAIVDHVKLQRESATAFHMATIGVWLDRASTFTSQALTFGGRIARNDITATLDGEGAECTLDGLYVTDGETLVDTHTTIDHAKPHCPSHELYKGILAGKTRAVFNGKIIVRQDAQKTDAKQTNKALLLTDDAQVNTKPQLEIFADDVKCTHGAAIGQLDEDAMFYMQARGISWFDARNLLIHAFAGEVLDRVKVQAVRDLAMKLMEGKLRLG